MRFAYIDSQGKEIGIPTLEALQLRIELGAIVASTMFFDQSSDKWAPAGEHEIFRTLQRELEEKEEGGFLAPPIEPVVPTATEAAPPEQVDRSERPAAPSDPLGDLTFELTPLDPEPEDETEPPAGEAEDAFDTGDFGILELEDAEPPDFVPGTPPGPSDLQLEPPLWGSEDFGDAPPDRAESSFELEQPLSEYSPDDAREWVDQEAEGSPPPSHEPAYGSAASEPSRAPRGRDPTGSSGPADDRPRAEPRSRPRSRPSDRPPERSSRAGLFGTVLLLALVAGGGWFGWSFFHGTGGEGALAGYEPVEIPSIAPELESLFQDLAPGALSDAVADMDGIRAAAQLPPEPPPDWLAGRYLANASRYPEVSAYWNALNATLGEMRASEEALFRTAFEARLTSAQIGAEDRGALLERALAGFQAARRERDAVFGRLTDVLVASNELHDFLLQNEDAIDYTPAGGGISRDPVLEAVPLTPQLGDEMWDRVDRITSALEVLGALTERVTTERLFSLTLERLAATPIH
jgi:hypothetical protein